MEMHEMSVRVLRFFFGKLSISEKLVIRDIITRLGLKKVFFSKKAITGEPIFLFCLSKHLFKINRNKYAIILQNYNEWIKILRAHGFISYMVTDDGNEIFPLIDPQPQISIQKMKKLVFFNSRDLCFVTFYSPSRYLLKIADKIYVLYSEKINSSQEINKINKKENFRKMDYSNVLSG